MAKGIDYWAVLRPGLCYHVYNHAVGTENLFRERDNYDFFLQRFYRYFEPYVQLYAYCLMPNHFHFLLQLKQISPSIKEAMIKEANQAAHAYLDGTGTLRSFYETQFRRFFTSYSRSYGKLYKRKGSLFQAKFKRIIIQSEAEFISKLCYIHHNPIHHGFCGDYESWAYQSYHTYLQNQKSKLSTQVVLDRIAPSSSDQLETFKRIHLEYKEELEKYFLAG